MHLGNLTVLLNVRSVNKSIQFYCDVLGARLAWVWDSEKKRAVCDVNLSKSLGLAAVHFGTSEILLRADPAHQPSGKPLCVVQFEVIDVEAFLRLADKRGLKPAPAAPTTTPWGSRQVFIRDPDGHCLSFASQTGVRLV